MRYIKLFEETNKLSVGDIVVCIDDDRATGIEKGQVYEIEEIEDFGLRSGKSFRLKGMDDFFLANRFISQFEYDTNNYNL